MVARMSPVLWTFFFGLVIAGSFLTGMVGWRVTGDTMFLWALPLAGMGSILFGLALGPGLRFLLGPSR